MTDYCTPHGLSWQLGLHKPLALMVQLRHQAPKFEQWKRVRGRDNGHERLHLKVRRRPVTRRPSRKGASQDQNP
jgi:hypothetical protein